MSLKDGITNTSCLSDQINDDFPIIGKPATLAHGKMISSLSATVVKSMMSKKSSPLFSNININENDNPVLFIYKIAEK